jgi:alkylation response protein AidB-like acyl-CoA dehydrogenase
MNFDLIGRAVASSDATNIELRIDRDGGEYVLSGRKWWTSNALHVNCRVLIVVGKTDPDDFPLARMYAHQRTLRLADGPDEVHKRTIAVHELRRWAPGTPAPNGTTARSAVLAG